MPSPATSEPKLVLRERDVPPLVVTDSADVTLAKRLLDYAKQCGFVFLRAAPGEDAPLVGNRVSGDWVDLIHLSENEHHL
jgi:hypothetical protein